MRVKEVRLKASAGFKNVDGQVSPENPLLLAAVSMVKKRTPPEPKPSGWGTSEGRPRSVRVGKLAPEEMACQPAIDSTAVSSGTRIGPRQTGRQNRNSNMGQFFRGVSPYPLQSANEEFTACHLKTSAGCGRCRRRTRAPRGQLGRRTSARPCPHPPRDHVRRPCQHIVGSPEATLQVIGKEPFSSSATRFSSPMVPKLFGVRKENRSQGTDDHRLGL